MWIVWCIFVGLCSCFAIFSFCEWNTMIVHHGDGVIACNVSFFSVLTLAFSLYYYCVAWTILFIWHIFAFISFRSVFFSAFGGYTTHTAHSILAGDGGVCSVRFI